MDLVTATMIADGSDDPKDYAQFIEAWQLLIDTGACWQLQGTYGRQASRMIESGDCQPFPRNPTKES